MDKCGTQGGKEETTSPSLFDGTETNQSDRNINRYFSDRNTNRYFIQIQILIKIQIH